MKQIRAMYAFDPTISAEQLIQDGEEWGVNSLILHDGFFKDDRMAELLGKSKIQLFLNLPLFNNTDYLKKHPESYAINSDGNIAEKDWYNFVCPSNNDYLKYRLDEMKEIVERVDTKFISIDFLRFPIFWELVDLTGQANDIIDGCYCKTCLSEFSKVIDAVIPETKASEFIRKNYKDEWALWKTDKIFNTARLIISTLKEIKPDAEYWIKTIPWDENRLDGAIKSSVGQDILRLATLVDGLSPMSFSHELHETLAWKKNFLDDLKQSTGTQVVTYLQTDKIYVSNDLSNQQFEEELQEALSGEYSGLFILSYEQLVINSEKVAILKKYL